jgi:hypothetical protein
VDVVIVESPAEKRKKLLNEIEQEIKKLPILGADLCVLTIATNIYEYIVVPGMYLATNILGLVEEHLTKLHNEGCRKLMVLLSTYGGEITFPEAFISRVRDMGFEKIYTFVLDIAFSAGTLLALLSDMILGFSNSTLGPVDPQLIVGIPGGVRAISAISVKRLIEELMPKLVKEQQLSKEDLVRLYAAQDLLLYEKALESINYIENIFNERICKNVNNCDDLKKVFLHGALEHSQPITLKQLKEKRIMLGKIIIVDEVPELHKLKELIISYRALIRYLFTFESLPGGAPGTIKAFVIGSKYGELVGQATLVAPVVTPPKQEQTAPKL